MRFRFSVRKIEKILKKECPICGRKMLYSPKINPNPDELLENVICLKCELLLDRDQLLKFKDWLNEMSVIEHKIAEAFKKQGK